VDLFFKITCLQCQKLITRSSLNWRLKENQSTAQQQGFFVLENNSKLILPYRKYGEALRKK
jgi:hypothetical protein